MSKPKKKVVWISAGVSSFVAGYIVRDTVDEWIYIDVEEQHEDSLRFIKDCEKAIGKKIKILKSPYKSRENVIRTFRYVNGPAGAKCTEVLKKRVRKEWEAENKGFEITYVWGFDCNEWKRAERLLESMPDFKHEFPLIDKGLTKHDVHGFFASMFSFERPLMYDLGYQNNNCVGCVKGRGGYWNKIRKDFPEVFERMAKLEREIGRSCINGIFLDELDPDYGRDQKEVMMDCGIACELALDEEWRKSEE